MKKLIALASFGFIALSANAQDQANKTASATQTARLVMSNAIELTFSGTGKDVGANVDMYFNDVNDYANGIESEPQYLKVRSNKDFMIDVMTKGDHFSFDGKGDDPKMPVEGVLGLKVTENATKGEVASPFSYKEYASLYSKPQKLIVDARRGGKQMFAVQYNATPGFEYPGGTYSVDVVYTATQQ